MPVQTRRQSARGNAIAANISLHGLHSSPFVPQYSNQQYVHLNWKPWLGFALVVCWVVACLSNPSVFTGLSSDSSIKDMRTASKVQLDISEPRRDAAALMVHALPAAAPHPPPAQSLPSSPLPAPLYLRYILAALILAIAFVATAYRHRTSTKTTAITKLSLPNAKLPICSPPPPIEDKNQDTAPQQQHQSNKEEEEELSTPIASPVKTSAPKPPKPSSSSRSTSVTASPRGPTTPLATSSLGQRASLRSPASWSPSRRKFHPSPSPRQSLEFQRNDLSAIFTLGAGGSGGGSCPSTVSSSPIRYAVAAPPTPAALFVASGNVSIPSVDTAEWLLPFAARGLSATPVPTSATLKVCMGEFEGEANAD